MIPTPRLQNGSCNLFLLIFVFCTLASLTLSHEGGNRGRRLHGGSSKEKLGQSYNYGGHGGYSGPSQLGMTYPHDYYFTPDPNPTITSFAAATSYEPYGFGYSHYSISSNFYNSENETSTAQMFNGSTPTPPVKENEPPKSKYTLFQTIIIAWVASCLGLLTVMGNILVMVSFKIDKQLQTISNYFLFSLAVADFLIGTHNTKMIHRLCNINK